jgi:two-component system, OmpR family, sensor kinase
MTAPSVEPVIDITEPAAKSSLHSRPYVGWFARNPLRVKLVAAVLALVALALVVIGTASAYVTRQYLLDRVDNQLYAFAQTLRANFPANQYNDIKLALPSEFAVGIPNGTGGWGVQDNTGSWHPPARDVTLTAQDLPAVSTTESALGVHMGQGPYTVIAQDSKFRWRVLVTTVAGGPVIIAHNLSTTDGTIDRLVAVELIFGASVLIALAVAGAWMVRASLRPLAAIERTAAAIAGGDLTQRVPELDPRTELGQLSSALNTMLSQIESAFKSRAASEARAVSSEERMRQFVADASHELRTPLTTIRGFAELYRQGATDDAGDVLRRIEDEASRMGLLVEDLLLLARLDEERPMQFEPVRVAEVLLDSATNARAVAPERPITVDIADNVDLTVTGDEGRLRQIVGNLVTNALTHTPPATPIHLRLRVEDPNVGVVEIADEGPGLDEEHARRVFERFYRVDKARTRGLAPPSPSRSPVAHNGSGLGLAIVAALVAAHRGTVELQTAPGRGATFRVRLPIDVA